jgi:hypothetical protein
MVEPSDTTKLSSDTAVMPCCCCTLLMVASVSCRGGAGGDVGRWSSGRCACWVKVPAPPAASRPCSLPSAWPRCQAPRRGAPGAARAHLHCLQQHVWRLRHAAVGQVVQEDGKADCRVRVEGLDGVVGGVGQHSQQAAPDLRGCGGSREKRRAVIVARWREGPTWRRRRGRQRRRRPAVDVAGAARAGVALAG